MSSYLKVLQELQRRQQLLDNTPLNVSPFQSIGSLVGRVSGTAASKASSGSESKRTTTSTGAFANAGKKAAQAGAFVVNPKSTLSDLEQISGIPANAFVYKRDENGLYQAVDNPVRSAQEYATKLFGKNFDDLSHKEKLTALKHGYNPSSRDYGIQYAMVPKELDSRAKEKYGKLYAELSDSEQMFVKREYENYYKHTYSLKGGNGSEIELFQVPQNFQDGYQFGDVVKTIGGSVADLGINVVQGAGSVVEGVVDWGTYAVADVADFFGADGFANDARGFGTTNYVEQWTGDLERAVDTHSVFGNTTDAVATGVGQVAAIVGASKLMAALGMTKGAAAAAGTTLNFLSTAGSAMSEAFEAGATPDEARAYGLICGGAAIITEKLIGGLGDDAARAFGKGFLDDKLSGIVNDKITDIVVQNWVKFGIKGIGEGVEETLEGFFEVLGKKLTYMSEEDFGKLLSDANLLEQFIVAAMTSYVAQVPSTHRANQAGVDVDTGLTQDETAVVDGLYNEAIAAEESKTGSKPKKSEQDQIRNEIMEDFQNGTLSPDFIEKTLDPENYQAYTEAKQHQDELQQEYDQLYNMKPMEKSDAQTDRQADLKAQLKQSKKQLQEITEKLRSNVKSRIQNSRLLESYNERTRSGQAFQADASQYQSEAARKTVQNIMDANVINNTNRTRKFVDFLAKISEEKGIVFSVTDAKRLKDTGFAIQDATVNGYFTEDGIAINISSSKALNSIVGHELTHALEGSELYDALKDVVVEYAKTTGNYDSHIAALKEIYSGKKGYETDLDAKAERELVADLVGDYLFSDTDFISRLSVKNRNLFQKIYDEIKYLAKLATSGSKEARQLEKVKHLFEQVYRDTKNTAQQTDGVKYSLNQFEDGTRFVDVEMDAHTFDGMTVADMNKKAKSILMNKFAGKVIGIDNRAFVNGDSVNEYLHPSKSIDNTIRKAKLTASGELDNLLDAGIPLPNEPDGKDGHIHPDAIDFSYYKTIFKVGSEYFEGIVNIKNIKRGKLLKDITKIRNITKDIVSSYGQNPKSNFLRDVSMYSLSENDQNVNAKLSLSENSEGNVPAGDQIYGQDVEIDLYDDFDADQDVEIDLQDDLDTDDDLETDVQEIDAEIERHLATSAEISRKMDAAAEAGDMEQYRTYKAMYNSLEERIRFLYQQKADVNAQLGRGFTNAPAEPAQPVRSVAPTREDIARMEAEKAEQSRQESRRIAPTREDIARLEQNQKETSSIKEQIRENLDRLNKTDPVANIQTSNEYMAMKKAEKQNWVVEKLRSTNYKVNRKNFGIISFAQKHLKSAFNYFMKGSAEEVSFEALPQVLENGIEITNRSDHKNRGYGTVTIAAPVIINGKRGNMAVVVKRTNENYYKVHRVLTPNGEMFNLADVKKETEPTPAGESPQNGSLATPISSVSPSIVAETETNVNQLQASQGTETQQAATDEDRAKAEKIVGDRNSVVSQLAAELYQEISHLKTGIQATQTAGYLLDQLEDKKNWQPLKTALLNIRDNPDQTVNEKSTIEAIARKMLNDEYDAQVTEWAEMFVAPTFKQPNNVREENIQKRYELVNELYSAVENRDTLPQDNRAGANYQISDLKAKIKRMQTERFKTAEQRRFKYDQYFSWAENLVGDTSTWVDKKTGWGYKTNTLRRNLRAIVKDANGNPDYQKADAINDALAGTYNRHEADLNRELTNFREKYADLKITKAEDAYIQMLGEFRSNPSTTITEDVIKDYYEKHKKQIDSQKVDKIIEMARQDYDQLIQRVNAVLREQGMKEIPYRRGYFPHFTEEKQGPLARLLNWKKKNDDIPTDIAGLTEGFEPVRSYQSFNKKRETDITDYSFKKGFDAYSFGALDWIYHIEDIQKRRALENYIRYIHSKAGVKAKIKAIKANEDYDADEAQQQIDHAFEEARNPLNNFVIDLRRGTQTLAGKKSSLDRDMEYDTNRRIYSTMTNISNRVSGNMVAGSVSAAMTNFIPITQSWAQVKMKSSLGAMAETIASTIRDDGTIEKSAFLTNRLRKAENLNKTGWDKISDKISWLMNAVDSFTSQTVWRSKYNENITSGMSEAEAIHDADLFAESVLAGRSRGNMPTIFDSKNPRTKMVTAFQLEVANQYGYLFQDVPQDLAQNGQNSKAKLIAHGTKKYLEVFFGAYAFNALYSALTGRNAAFDPVSIVEDLLKDMGIGAEDEEEEKKFSEILGNLTDNILEEVPFVGGFLGGGRVPISSALPYDNIMETVLGTIKDVEEGDWGNFTKEWLNPVYYGLMPMGGGQLKKTVEGASMFVGDKPVTGSYTADGKLRYEVKPDWQNILQALTFGQWANQNAQDYIENGYKPLSENQLTEFTESGIPYGNYRNYITELSKLQRLSEMADYIDSLPISTDQKNLLINNRSGRKDQIDMEDYGEYGSFAEFDFAENNIMKYRFLQDRGISYREYTESKAEYDFAYENPEKYDFLEANGVGYYDYALEGQDFRDAWSWAYENQEKYAVSKAVTGDVAQYRKYISDLYDIRADKDANGKSISGSAKKKKLAYINSLDIDYGAKIILFKSLYPNDNRYNEDIILYLKSQENITAAELRTILKELNFIITADGRIGWEN